MKLVLFDIDGTLIRDDGAAREAYAKALREVYAFPGTLHSYDFSGRTDPQITHEVLSHEGYEPAEIDGKMDRLWSSYLEELERLVTATRIRVLPGVVRLLELLAREDHVALGLLTGNIERGARIKLEPHDLNRFFPFGAFGSDAAEREKLPPFAVERARQAHGRHFTGRDVVVIGDSIYDIRCGVPHQATTIAVATGHTSGEKLRAENPDYFFENLEPLDDILAAIRGH
jgi:phosphoglycolate phosphatase-like HAD superfamily hydrolase